MKKQNKSESLKTPGPIFKAKAKKKPLSVRMSDYVISLIQTASEKHNVSHATVIESCVIYALEDKKSA